MTTAASAAKGFRRFPFDANMPIRCELIPKRGLTPDQYGLVGRPLKQFCIDQRCPIADFRAVQHLFAGELSKPLVLRRIE